MSEKIALQGLSGVKLFPIKKNDITGYEADEGIPLPWIQEMTKESDTSESKIYADDGIYLNMKNWNGLNVTLTVAQMPLEYFETLGFGQYDEDTQTLIGNPQGVNKQFALALRCLMVNGKYRMFKFYSFTVNEIKESTIKTKGDGGDVNSYEIIGTITKRSYDDKVYEIHDGNDLEWIDSMDKMPRPLGE